MSGVLLRFASLSTSVVLLTGAASAQAGGFVQGPKLLGGGAGGAANQGVSVAVSADGNTAIVGGPFDSSGGAAWVFSRSGGSWTQQGGKLAGSGAAGAARQGFSVALSSDGNTAILGGPFDNSNAGAAWVFTRNLGVWTQQGGKLVGSGAAGKAFQAWSVALSADGNTAILGGTSDNSYVGASWVFTRSGGVWTQQGGKLVGSGAAGASTQGNSVALSADGNTAIVGGPDDASLGGAAWVFTRTGSAWNQQGEKLVGSGAVGGSEQGSSVALSSDGGTAVLGGPADSSNVGAAWVFSRSGGVWTQQGDKLVGGDAIGNAFQGSSVALSSNGNTAVVGGNADNNNVGAAWAFTRSGNVWMWDGAKLVGMGADGNAQQGGAVALSSDGNTAIVGGLADNNYAGAAWVFMRICGHGDVSGDGAVDVSDVFYLINFLFAGGPAPACY